MSALELSRSQYTRQVVLSIFVDKKSYEFLRANKNQTKFGSWNLFTRFAFHYSDKSVFGLQHQSILEWSKPTLLSGLLASMNLSAN
jgi:hypothetical protein